MKGRMPREIKKKRGRWSQCATYKRSDCTITEKGYWALQGVVEVFFALRPE